MNKMTEVKRLIIGAVVFLVGGVLTAQNIEDAPCYRLKTSLNAFSFNAPFTKGEIDIEGMIDYCVEIGIDAIDLTAYYFSNYPEVPSDEAIHKIKRKAFLSGVEISGTGVRNDFTHADPTKRAESVELVKSWIEVAAKLGAPVIRVFAGTQETEGFSKEEVDNWIIEALKECVAYGKQHGVVIGLQNHNDFIQTADHIKEIFNAVNSEWLGLIMDTGGYRQANPYKEIEETIALAVNWQIKEKIFEFNEEKDTDFEQLLKIIKQKCYKGYIPIETLGPGNAKEKIKMLHQNVLGAAH